MIKICEECGLEFNAKNSRQRFCKNKHIARCEVCGVEFEYSCIPTDRPHTCSKKCKQLYRVKKLQEKYGVNNVSQIEYVREKKRISNASEEAQNKRKQTCLGRYGVENVMQVEDIKKKQSASFQSPEAVAKRKNTFLEHYGVDHVFKLEEYRKQHGCDNVFNTYPNAKNKATRTIFERYGVTNVSNIPGVTELSQAKREASCLEKYGTDCIFKSQEFKDYIASNFGVDNIIYSPEHRSKAMRNKQNKSSLEIRLHNFLEAYDIEYVEEYVINSGDMMHSFDVYLPKYKVLIDCDGEYWHSYLSDPDGERVRDDMDDIRISLVPNDHIFHLIIESNFERGLSSLQNILKKIDSNIFDYDSYIFKWCREVGFPYYSYDNKRMIEDWDKLSKLRDYEYNPNKKFGMSIINQFHRSIYDSHVKSSVSPRVAWEDDKLLKKVIANRLIYKNSVDPSKVLQGFNISKIATKVSVFNPVLASYLCNKYLKEFTEICDPFSGFSGRMLGCVASGKSYIGRDINQTHVDESNQIIDFLHLDTAQVCREDILETNRYIGQALMTCPPYGDKEIYGDESCFKICDEWMDIVLDRYKCDRYIFVVDKTNKFKDNVVEELKCRSHFRKSSEYVVLLDRS